MFFVLITPEKLAGKRNKHRSFSICVWRKLGIGNDIGFEKLRLKIFSVHTKTLSQCFQIPPV